MYIVFETPRLILRRFTEADASLVFALNSDPEILKYLHEPKLESEGHALDILREIILPQYDRNLGRWAIHEKVTNEFIGWCGLKYRPELDETDLGYRLMQKAWGKGYATEAAFHTLSHGFGHLGLPVISACAHIENLASIKVLEKIGMEYTGEGIVDDCPVRVYIKNNPGSHTSPNQRIVKA